MHKFHFKLERLRQYRKIREGQAEADFAKAARVFLHEKERFQHLEMKLTQLLEELKHEQGNCASLLTIKMFQDSIDTTREEIKQQASIVAAAADRRQSSLRKFEDATRKRKGVDNLKEKKTQQYQADLLHEEQTFLDELSGQRHVRES